MQAKKEEEGFGASVPPAGAVFEHGADALGEPHRYRVVGWMRRRAVKMDAVDFVFSGAMTGEAGGRLAITTAEVIRDLYGAPDERKPVMEFCPREFATHVSGAGVSGCIVPISKIKVVGMVAWSQEAIEEAHDYACVLGVRRSKVD